jgi:hypothetical protein
VTESLLVNGYLNHDSSMLPSCCAETLDAAMAAFRAK